MGRESRETAQGSVPDAMALDSNRADQKVGVGAAVGVFVTVVMI
jgi:hypothetical protein